jgi:hypothetical protein
MDSTAKRTTIYFDPNLHESLRKKASAISCSLSELVNVAIREYLAEDAEDLAAFSERNNEPLISYSEILQKLAVQKK